MPSLSWILLFTLSMLSEDSTSKVMVFPVRVFLQQWLCCEPSEAGLVMQLACSGISSRQGLVQLVPCFWQWARQRRTVVQQRCASTTRQQSSYLHQAHNNEHSHDGAADHEGVHKDLHDGRWPVLHSCTASLSLWALAACVLEAAGNLDEVLGKPSLQAASQAFITDILSLMLHDAAWYSQHLSVAFPLSRTLAASKP